MDFSVCLLAAVMGRSGTTASTHLGLVPLFERIDMSVPRPRERMVLTMSYHRLGSDTYNPCLHTYTTRPLATDSSISHHLSPARFLRSRCALAWGYSLVVIGVSLPIHACWQRTPLIVAYKSTQTP